MPTNVDQSSFWRAMEGIKRNLKTITRADGFNTTPKVAMGAVIIDEIPETNFPSLRIEMGDLAVSQELHGGGQGETGKIRYDIPVFIWGYVKTTEGRDALYRAGFALLLDVLSAIYGDETAQDGLGQGSRLFANPEAIPFDMEAYSAKNKGYFVAEFRLVVEINRGANP